MVFNGELFWGGDRIGMLVERLGTRKAPRPLWEAGTASRPGICALFGNCLTFPVTVKGDLPRACQACSEKTFQLPMTSQPT